MTTAPTSPRAIRHFGLAAMEARAQRTRQAVTPPPLPAVSEVKPPAKRVVIRLWIPSTLLFLVLAPFALLLAPLMYFAPPAYRARPLAALWGVGAVLLSLGGTVVDIDAPDARVLIRLF